jgi:SAM-dependent methyltransferase
MGTSKRDAASQRADRIQWFHQLLGTFPVGKLIDLGSGHGMFAREAANAGWTVTALDARGDRYPADEPRIDWQVGDVRDVDFADFDVIACLGLFYHLTVDDQLDLLARTKGKPIILDTHVAINRQVKPQLSEMMTVGGYEGRLYAEPDQATHSPASWGNDESFWPRVKELYRMLDLNGYDVLTATPWYLPSRTFFLCLPRRQPG